MRHDRAARQGRRALPRSARSGDAGSGARRRSDLLADWAGGIDVAMNIRTIIGLRDKAPFRPFGVHLANGRSIRVHHPDLLSPSPTGRELVIRSPDGSLNLVDADQVTSVALPKRNGTRRLR